MFVRAFKSAALAVALFGLSTAAGAATIFNFSFSAPWVLSTQTGTGSGQLYAEDLGNGTYEVTGVSGTSKVTAASSAVALNTVSAAALSSLSITGNPMSGFTFTGMLSGGSTTYNFARNLFDSNYTISNGLRTTSAGTFSLALVPPPAPVPEAATWVMMILGFGGIGMMLRSGKRRDRMQIAIR